MDVLLLGGTGTLSSAVRDLSIARGYNVSIFNRGKNNNNIPSKLNIIIGDFKKRESFESCFSNKYYDIVVDFLSRDVTDIERMFSTFQGKCKQYIFISTACVYLRENVDTPLTEDAEKPNPLWRYSIDKYNCEKWLKKTESKSSTTFYTIVRPYITYDNQRIPLGISPIPYYFHRTIIERIKSGKPWFVWDGGNSIVTTTYVSDFAIGVVGLFMNPKAKNEDFHITSNYNCTNRQLVELLFQKLKVQPYIVDIKTKEICECLPEYKDMLIADRALDARFDNTKIKTVVKDLNFKTSLDEGLDMVIDYWMKSSFYEYDYQFEGRIDKLLSKYVKVNFVRYPHANKTALIVYYLYRYLPLKWASKLAKYVKKR